MTPGEFAAIEALAALAREDTFRPGWPFGGTGEWTENLSGLLGGPVGDFVGAVSPDVVDSLIAAVRERDKTISQVRVMASEWADQPNDYDEDTEQQIEDGRAVLAALGLPLHSNEIRTFQHSRKGLIVGRIIRDDGTWTQIELARDHKLVYGSEMNRGRIDEEGEILVVRSAFLTEVPSDG